MALKRVSFLVNVTPRGAITDMVNFWRQPTPHRWPILALSAAISFTMLAVLIPESERAAPPKPKVTWITTLDAHRTDAEIAASNAENQARQDRLRARSAALDEQRKDAFRAIGRATFLDVDALEKQFSDGPAPPRATGPAPARTPGAR